MSQSETLFGFIGLGGLALVGLIMVAISHDHLMAVHGGIFFAAAMLGIFALITYATRRKLVSPEVLEYNDEVTRAGILIALFWGVVGFAVGDWLAWQLTYPALNFDLPWTNFGRLRPVHTSAVIFGFGGNALIATSFYVVQRTSKARLAGTLAPWFVLFGFNLFCIIAATGYLMGITQSREYAEPEWYADIWLVVVWVTYFIVYMTTLARRAEPHIYVANWYYLAFIVVVAMLHIVNALAVPIALGATKSYGLFAGVQDAMTQWWYGHNAVGFSLTAGFLGMMYYFLPKSVDRPIYSYRLGIIGFWGITFMYLWVGSHHLHYTALPDWVQTLGMTFSVMLLVPSWSAMINGVMTLNGAWDKLRTDPSIRFLLAAVAFYGLSTFEGSFMAIKAVNSLSHYTDWTVGHVHGGALGWLGFITFGTIYTLVPWLWKRPGMYSTRMVAWHFWLGLAGVVIYLTSMWNSGITQALMWRTYDEAGYFGYSFIDSVVAMHPYYFARALGGLLFLLGALIGAYNVWRTIKGRVVETELSDAQPEPAG